jgi:hypothetical protein
MRREIYTNKSPLIRALQRQRKVVPAHLTRLFRRKPLLAAIVVVADEFLLFSYRQKSPVNPA